MHLPLLHIELGKLAWSAPFLKTFDNMRKLDFFRLPAPRCASTAAGADSLKKSNFLMFSKVLRNAPDQANNNYTSLILAYLNLWLIL